MRVLVDFSWRDIGPLRLEEGRLRFPDAPDVPGIYRFDLADRVYIGEADRLRRRFQHYRTPGPTQTTNIRLNRAMVDLLTMGGSISVCTITTARVDVDGIESPLDLAHKAARLLVENAALTPSMLISRRPRQNAPGVRFVASGTQPRANSSRSGSTPRRARAWEIAGWLGMRQGFCQPDSQDSPSIRLCITSS